MSTELAFWPRLVLAVLATWRITHLLTSEDGPADTVVRLRSLLGNGLLGQLMDCFYCLSLWVAAPFALFLSNAPLDWLVGWLGLSGAACLIERVSQVPPIMVKTTALSQGEVDGMLRPEASRTEDPRAGD